MAAATTAFKKTHCFRRMIASPSRSSSMSTSSSAYHKRSKSSSRPTSPLTSDMSAPISQKLSSSSIDIHSDGKYFFDAKKFSPLSSPLKETYRNNFNSPTSCYSGSLQNLEQNQSYYQSPVKNTYPVKFRRYNSATALRQDLFFHLILFFQSRRHWYVQLVEFCICICRDENGGDNGSIQLENDILSYITSEINCNKSDVIQNAAFSVPTTPLDAIENVGSRKYSLDDPSFTPSVPYDYKPNYTEITALGLSCLKTHKVF